MTRSLLAWSGRSAVGNLESDSIVGTPDTSKGVVSVWVFVPADTAEAAEEAYNDGSLDYAVFNGVIPIITWGAQQEGTIYEWSFSSALKPHPDPPHTVFDLGLTGVVTGNHSNYRPPSFIGINCVGGLYIEANLQSSSFPDCTNTTYTVDDINFQGEFSPYLIVQETSIASYTDEGTPTHFGGTGASIGATDTWHHILFSWDLTGGCSVIGTGTSDSDFSAPYSEYITSACMMWLAIDDVNKTGNDLPALWIGANGGDEDPNGIVTELCSEFSGAQDLLANEGVEGYEFNYGSPSISETVTIPVDPISIPSSLSVHKPTDDNGASTVVSPNLLIRMAEMQVFFGVTLDTSVEANRRAFITESGRPASPSLAAALLEQAPYVHFKTHTDFITGNNQGTAGDFTPTGTINPFSPGP